MTDMVRMTPDDFAHLSEQMRMANTGRLKAVLDSLEPYIDGSLGAVSPPHVNAYIKVCRELGLLWAAYAPPRPVEQVDGGDEDQMVLEARQGAVLAELAQLRQVAARRPGRAA